MTPKSTECVWCNREISSDTEVVALFTGLIQKLEEENRVNTFMLKDKLPKDLSTLKKSCADLQRVVAEPAMGQSDLDEINKKVTFRCARRSANTFVIILQVLGRCLLTSMPR